ncbi:hypothetical protein ACFFWD_14610 [Bradyrhizobium erythrophlei]|uniref:hypothetical protein n=1 Tax=Bradyrhizobium erythrophlei TaxID=1437360 RepID=UPI0035E52625
MSDDLQGPNREVLWSKARLDVPGTVPRTHSAPPRFMLASCTRQTTFGALARGTNSADQDVVAGTPGSPLNHDLMRVRHAALMRVRHADAHAPLLK